MEDIFKFKISTDSQKQIKQLIRDKKLIDSFFDTRIPLNMRRRIVAQEREFLGFLLPLISKVAAPLFGKLLR